MGNLKRPMMSCSSRLTRRSIRAFANFVMEAYVDPVPLNAGNVKSRCGNARRASSATFTRTGEMSLVKFVPFAADRAHLKAAQVGQRTHLVV